MYDERWTMYDVVKQISRLRKRAQTCRKKQTRMFSPPPQLKLRSSRADGARRFSGGGHHGGDFVSLIAQGLQLCRRNKTRENDKLQPILAFVCLFLADFYFCQKIRTALGMACRSIICSHGRCAAQQLLADHSPLGASRLCQRGAKLNHPQSERYAPLQFFFFVHASV